ncbi:hypothetical protein PHYBLDRAFT_67352 [Phycomyces blakesleeanus NRRL 1555(-)]|uniref:Uncharacterized protein n=1 Tax=Phycomyces blakesleeanus (strain ATCC 8743b / DSM 1359 / FGSC 10004 / NBRC 33097 / NRRL 1555) TaxID=763407 RepID=A0A167K3S0_PHYB8|nr:hypothetical protein PHYBLDRAFT_67352 [Phycomyces blakesleeanus NRRL 1555(-)]OAD67217.1 hypothetical protein PHYBLDRAFT_67352 [Phycomyces blakesleeanus NRRL 1555(-)]|eukprot:XP_018285257.1 hypothetical protein PHYBLDRAFT_67352 [Phycomyces blakesleeanus NRRL 1555(-)]
MLQRASEISRFCNNPYVFGTKKRKRIAKSMMNFWMEDDKCQVSAVIYFSLLAYICTWSRDALTSIWASIRLFQAYAFNRIVAKMSNDLSPAGEIMGNDHEEYTTTCHKFTLAEEWLKDQNFPVNDMAVQ